MIFVCENNLYGEYTAKHLTTPIDRIADRADAYSMAKDCIDGNDIAVVHGAVAAAAERGRAGQGPTLVEALTYRHKGHSRTDPGKYRPKEEVELWLGRDPIPRVAEQLRARGVDVDAVEAEARAAIAEALERATTWDDPAPGAMFEDVMA